MLYGLLTPTARAVKRYEKEIALADPITRDLLTASGFRLHEPDDLGWPVLWKMIAGPAYIRQYDDGHHLYLQKSAMMTDGWYATITADNGVVYEWPKPLWDSRGLGLFLELMADKGDWDA